MKKVNTINMDPISSISYYYLAKAWHAFDQFLAYEMTFIFFKYYISKLLTKYAFLDIYAL